MSQVTIHISLADGTEITLGDPHPVYVGDKKADAVQARAKLLEKFNAAIGLLEKLSKGMQI